VAIKGVEVFQVPYLADTRGNFQKIHFQDAPSAAWNRVEEVFFTKTWKGSIRGMHLQWGSCSTNKIVKCLEGEVLDVLVDLRPDSKTYLEILYKILSGVNQEALLIPEGVGHGYQVLSETAIMYYATDKPWCKHCDLTLNPFFDGVEWPIAVTNLSEKDLSAPKLDNFLDSFAHSKGFQH